MGDDASGFVECLAANKITCHIILILHEIYSSDSDRLSWFSKDVGRRDFSFFASLHPCVSLIRAQNVRVERDESVVLLIPASWNDLRRISLVLRFCHDIPDHPVAAYMQDKDVTSQTRCQDPTHVSRWDPGGSKQFTACCKISCRIPEFRSRSSP